MRTSTTVLAAVLGGVTLFGLAAESIHLTCFGEVASKRAELEAGQQQLSRQRLALQRAKADCELFEQRVDRSLPSDPAKATVLYQEYLVQLAEACQLESVVIGSAEAEEKESLGHVLHFSIQGNGATLNLGRFVDGFYKTNALHRLSRLNIFQSLGPDSPIHSFSFDIEVLTLQGQQRHTDTPIEITVPSSYMLSDLFAGGDVFRRPQPRIVAQDVQPTTDGGMFSGLMAAFQTPPVETEETPVSVPLPEPTPPDPRDTVRLVGIIGQGETKSALFYDSLNDQQTAVSPSDSIGRLGIESLLIEIRQDSVVVEEAGTTRELSMGELYRDAEFVGE